MSNIISLLGSFRFLIITLSILILTNVYLSTKRLHRLKQYQKDQVKLNKLKFKQNIPPPIPPFAIKDCTHVWSDKNNLRYVLLKNEEKIGQLYPRNNTLQTPEFNWGNVIVLMLIYDNDEVTQLLQSHFTTWINQMPKDLDIVFSTDAKDNRTFYEIFPLANTVAPRIHLHKSVYSNDGKRTKLKMIDSLRHIYFKFKGWNKKLIVMKIDTDTFVIPENLLQSMKEVHSKTYPLPVNFGRVDCQDYYGYGKCYTVGGSYGMSKVGIGALLSYYNDPNCLECKRPVYRKHSPLLDEDYFLSLTYQNATCLPSIHVSGMSIRLYARDYVFHGPKEGEWDTTKKHVTIHLVKSSENFTKLQKFYYFDNGTLRDEFRL